MKKDNGYYGMSLRIENNSPISEWLNAQENKSASIKALIAMAIETYGADEDVITCAMIDSKVGKMVRRQQKIAEQAVERNQVSATEAKKADKPKRKRSSRPKMKDDKVEGSDGVPVETSKIKDSASRKHKIKRKSANNWRDMM